MCRRLPIAFGQSPPFFPPTHGPTQRIFSPAGARKRKIHVVSKLLNPASEKARIFSQRVGGVERNGAGTLPIDKHDDGFRTAQRYLSRPGRWTSPRARVFPGDSVTERRPLRHRVVASPKSSGRNTSRVTGSRPGLRDRSRRSASQPGSDLGFIRLSSIILSSSMPEMMMSGSTSSSSAEPLSV